MQNKYLISKQSKHLHVQTLSTARTPEPELVTPAASTARYESLPMTTLRERIITFWWVLLNSTEQEQKRFLDHLHIPDFVKPTDSMKVSEWFNRQTADTKHKLVNFVRLMDVKS